MNILPTFGLDLHPARYPGESFSAYKKRRAAGKKHVVQHLRAGTPLWTSVVIVEDAVNQSLARKVRVQGTFRHQGGLTRLTKKEKKADRRARTFANLLNAHTRGLIRFRANRQFSH